MDGIKNRETKNQDEQSQDGKKDKGSIKDVSSKTVNLTPMMKQYLSMKEENPSCLLFFRLGDFYELFFDDALTASRELEITLTGRDCGLSERAPMCGVPHHALDAYLNKLIAKGYKVAICEQLTDPSESKGIVKRGIVRIVTPGTVIEEGYLDKEKPNYIVSVFAGMDFIGLASADVSTGEFYALELTENPKAALMDELARIMPSEIVVNSYIKEDESLYSDLKRLAYTDVYADWAYEFETATKNLCSHFAVASLDGFGCSGLNEGVCAAGALMAYLNETQKNSLSHISNLKVLSRHNYMVLDGVTRRNLELVRPLNEDASAKKTTLFGLLNRSKTSMGARMIRSWIDEPLYDSTAINKRSDAVEELLNELSLRDTLRELLQEVFDIERMTSKLAYNSFNARDALALKRSLSVLPRIKDEMSKCKSDLLNSISGQIDKLDDVFDLLERAVYLDPPVGLKEGNLIRDGYNESIDSFRNASKRGQDWLKEIENREREATNIKNLKIGINKVFGYYIEVTKSYLDKVPFRYQRKQTLANCERYITDELKELEGQILGAQDKLLALEYEVFSELRTKLTAEILRLKLSADAIAKIDALQSLATVAQSQNYKRAEIHDGISLEIIDGRHPIVEGTERDRFVANDCEMDENDRLMIITGPNMAGKSTYMRQVALITIMAHIGSFVPAKSAKIPLTDRVFTRVGASDNLAAGQSTFMVEMSETANILQNASNRSLLILDEIGRGTSTFDGLSIAWAVCEHISDKNKCGAKTLFATHYHELSELEGYLDGAVNYRITAKELEDEVIFLRKVVRGGSDKSYGIQVARLAGLPHSVIKRAKEILAYMEAGDLKQAKTKQETLGYDLLAQAEHYEKKENAQQQALLKELANLEVDAMTPLEALTRLSQLKNEAREISFFKI